MLDLYPYATTSPIYLDGPGGPATARQDAAYFTAWLDRVIDAAATRDGYLNDAERQQTLEGEALEGAENAPAADETEDSEVHTHGEHPAEERIPPEKK